MGNRFNLKDANMLLAKCHRRCCICHRFCGIKLEIDHIKQKADGGSNDIDNAIPVCFECHAEIHSYNDKHPRGRKFHPDELSEHKKQWLEICENRPDVFIIGGWESDVGPLQALIDELEFNEKVSHNSDTNDLGCLFQESQFHRAIKEGSIAILLEEIKSSILDTYSALSRANQLIISAISQPLGNSRNKALNHAQEAILKAKPKIEASKRELLKFLAGEK